MCKNKIGNNMDILNKLHVANAVDFMKNYMEKNSVIVAIQDWEDLKIIFNF